MFSFFRSSKASKAVSTSQETATCNNDDDDESDTSKLTEFPPYGSATATVSTSSSQDDNDNDDDDDDNVQEDDPSQRMHGSTVNVERDNVVVVPILNSVDTLDHYSSRNNNNNSNPSDNPGQPMPIHAYVHSIKPVVNLEKSGLEHGYSGNTESAENEATVNWMPDELCKTCYACEVDFNMFRRRHHCRLCGQVFCSNCSAYSLDVSKSMVAASPGRGNVALSGKMRVCKMCYTSNVGGRINPNSGQQPESAQFPPPSGSKLENVTNEGLLSLSSSMPNYVEAVEEGNVSGKQMSEMERVKGVSGTIQSDPTSKTLKLEYVESKLSHRNSSSKLTEDGPFVSASSSFSSEKQLGQVAADQLEIMCCQLLQNELGDAIPDSEREGWTNVILSLATKCCNTIIPGRESNPGQSSRRGSMDIRPYIKVKTISGGNRSDCEYIPGIMFQKHVTHKLMAKQIMNPKILLLSGGIDYTRSTSETTHRGIATLDGISEAEDMYLKIFLNKVLTLNPNVILVGKAISRRAQEMLLNHNVVAIQHVKQTTLSRVALQTGASILHSSDVMHMNMNMNNADDVTSLVGMANMFRLVTYLDQVPSVKQPYRHKSAARSAELAALILGDTELDGSRAIQTGLAKRGITRTYVVVDGCPPNSGCTIILRGLSSENTLKKLKRIFLFMAHVAYNLKLEVAYLKERCVCLPETYSIDSRKQYNSSSLCVDYGSPPPGRKNRPWNGLLGSNFDRNDREDNDKNRDDLSGEKSSPFDHQSILITSVWMTGKTQCCPAEVKGICYYTKQDVTLGQFLRDSCFNLQLKCQNQSCKKSVLDHTLSFIHNDGQVNITVQNMDYPLPPPSLENSNVKVMKCKPCTTNSTDLKSSTSPIATWTFCNICRKVVTPLVYISNDVNQYSFGKFLEVYFYNRTARLNAAEHGCSCQMQTSATLFFGCGRLVARFSYNKVNAYNVYVRRHLPFDNSVYRRHALRQLDIIRTSAHLLFAKFQRHVDKVARETRTMFGSTANQPENLQALLSELTLITQQVEIAGTVLLGRINTVIDLSSCETGSLFENSKDKLHVLIHLPLLARRYLFVVFHSFNDRLSAIGQTLLAMRKLSSALRKFGPDFNGSDGDARKSLVSNIMEGMSKLRQLQAFYSVYDIGDISFSSSSSTSSSTFLSSEAQTETQRLPRYHTRPSRLDAEYQEFDDEIEYDDDDIVLRGQTSQFDGGAPIERVKKSLGSRRYDMDDIDLQQGSRLSVSDSKSAKHSPGGAVKSAINRFFNRHAKELDPYVIDLGHLGEGRLRLEPGVGNVIIPIIDEHPASIVAYSLASVEYDNQFRDYAILVDGLSATGSNDSSSRPDSTHINDVSSMGGSQNKASHPSWMLQERKDIERRMLARTKTHIKHSWRDLDAKGNVVCKFVCTSYWTTQFQAVRQAFMGSSIPPSSRDSVGQHAANPMYICAADIESHFVLSLSNSQKWAASGGKSGAAFSRTFDEMFVIKSINRTELQMFLDCAPSYFEYLSKSFFHGLPTILCKIVGVYQIGYHNRATGKRTMEQVAVMQNMFYGRNITRLFDLKGSLRGRTTQAGTQFSSKHGSTIDKMAIINENKDNDHRKRDDDISDDGRSQDESNSFYSDSSSASDALTDEEMEDEQQRNGVTTDRGNYLHRTTNQNDEAVSTYLDGDFLEFTSGHPLPLNDRARAVFHMSILNDTLFLSIINVLDYSMLVGIDSDRMELVVGIIDFMRQYDILKQMERVGKSIPMVVGQEAPTIIQPPLYKQRFTNAMERYFMTVPNKWTSL